jgi:hypothetical protein
MPRSHSAQSQTSATAKPKPAEAAPVAVEDRAPPPPRRIIVHQDEHSAPARILAEHEDGTLDLLCELWPGRVLTLHGVHKRVGHGNGWEER